MEKEEKELHSKAASEGADRLLLRIENGSMGMEIMPQYYTQFTGKLEQQDYVSYCRFLRSSNGKKIIQMLEEADESELFEL